MRVNISNMVVMGDSLSDRGDMADDKLFGVIPMDTVTGLADKSPDGRFTNGLVWTDFLGLHFAKANRFQSVDLSNPAYIQTETGNTLIRTACKGGATASDWFTRLTPNPVRLGTQAILSRLEDLRRQIFEDDDAICVSQKEKSETLVIEWSGANDLITVNDEPTIENAQQAVEARIHNIREMMKKGYQHFCLLNLPDLSLTPRYQRKDSKTQERVRAVCEFFNEKLSQELKTLQSKCPACSFNLHDANRTFVAGYQDPAQFGLDPARKAAFFTESDDFNNTKDKRKAQGYMFWDDVHPTQRVHEELAKQLYLALDEKYQLEAPHEPLRDIFREHYGRNFEKAESACCSTLFAPKSRINYKDENLTPEKILMHALYEGGSRTKEVIQSLRWINKKGELVSKHPRLQVAMKTVQETYRAKMEPARQVVASAMGR